MARWWASRGTASFCGDRVVGTYFPTLTVVGTNSSMAARGWRKGECLGRSRSEAGGCPHCPVRRRPTRAHSKPAREPRGPARGNEGAEAPLRRLYRAFDDAVLL